MPGHVDAPAVELIPDDYFRFLRRAEIFPDTSRVMELDVGSGDGTFLLQLAQHHPERDFLGIERLGGRVKKICRRAGRMGLTNVRVLCLESSYTLGWILPDACATRLHLLFPDPWPKKRHESRRFVQPENLKAMHRVLAPTGELLIKTDDADYFAAAGEVLDTSPMFHRTTWLPAEEFYPQTDFEAQWIKEGRVIHAARWLRI